MNLFNWLFRLNLPKKQEGPSFICKFGLGDYQSHNIIGVVEDDKGKVYAGVVCYDEVDPLRVKGTALPFSGGYINFPVENKLVITYERGREYYICFNLNKSEYDALQSPQELWKELMKEKAGTSKWKLQGVYRD